MIITTANITFVDSGFASKNSRAQIAMATLALSH